jgi:NIPSNAP protein
MQRLELATLSIRTGTAAAALQGIERYTAQCNGPGTLAGMWTSEIGGVNRILVLRSFDAQDELFAERAQVIESGDFFGTSEQLVDTASPRTRVRGEAVSSGAWAPKEGPDWLTVMQAAICMPAKFSPMR